MDAFRSFSGLFKGVGTSIFVLGQQRNKIREIKIKGYGKKGVRRDEKKNGVYRNNTNRSKDD